MGLTLLDTSAVVAFLDTDDALRPGVLAPVTDVLRGGDSLAISSVTWAEALFGARIGHVHEAVLREFVVDLNVRILPIDSWTAERAAALQYAYRQTRTRAPWPKLRTPDAMILATSLVRPDVTRIIGGDAQWANVPGVEAELVLLRDG